MAINELDRAVELELIRSARSGDREAFRTLASSIRPRLVAYLRDRLSARPEIDPEGIAQEVLLSVWRTLDRFDEQYRWGQMVLGYASNRVKSALRKKQLEVPIERGEGGSSDRGRVRDLPLDAISTDDPRRFASPDPSLQPSAVFLEVIEAMLGWGGYPHQQIAFGYSIVAWGRPNATGAKASGRTKVPITGDPDQVVEELSADTLDVSSAGFREHLEAGHPSARWRLEAAFVPLSYRLGISGAALFARDVTSKSTYAHLLDQRVGATHLREYYGKDPRKSVADWTNGVKDRTLKYLRGELDLSRSPLPWPEGHEN